jgi:hypothetical protein
MILQLRSAIALFTCSCLVNVAIASSSSVGLVMTTGVVDVDGQSVPNNSAIFSGSRVSSGDRTSNLQFADGTSAVMNPGTIMTVYRERSVLQQGVTMQRGADKHSVLANGLRISGATPNTTVMVGVKNASYMEISARDGEADVWTPSGNLVARIEPGQPLSVTYQQAQANDANSAKEVNICGSLRQGYLLTDELSRVHYQLQPTQQVPASDLDPRIDKRVSVTGIRVSPPSADPEVIAVSSIQGQDRPCEAAAVGPGAAPASVGGDWKWGSLLILLALLGAGAAIGVAAAGGGSSPSPPPVTPAVP